MPYNKGHCPRGYRGGVTNCRTERGSLTNKAEKPKDYHNTLIKETKLKETPLSEKEESSKQMSILSHWHYKVMLSKEEGD